MFEIGVPSVRLTILALIYINTSVPAGTESYINDMLFPVITGAVMAVYPLYITCAGSVSQTFRFVTVCCVSLRTVILKVTSEFISGWSPVADFSIVSSAGIAVVVGV